jgi:carboxylate/amino acid/amine transporter
MIFLLVVSLLWAFSFGLIKGNLTGVDSNFVSFARILTAFLVFLPFIRFRKLKPKFVLKLTLTGLVQFGLMYIAYIAAFKFLNAYEVALFTIFTPIFVTLLDDLLRRKFSLLHLIVAFATVIGTWIVESQRVQTDNFLTGFLLIQASNLFFAFGQIYYRKLMAQEPGVRDREVFGILYLGGALVTGVVTLVFVPLSSITLTSKQILTLLYLGVVASGAGFFLWNFGARKVAIGTLAIFNDLKIPLAILVSLLFFGEEAKIPALLLGGSIILATLLLNELLERKKKIT